MSIGKTYSLIKIDDKELEDSLSKISVGFSLVLIEDRNKYLVITGKKDLFKSIKSNLKSSYSNNNQEFVEVYMFDLKTNKITLLPGKGKIPKVSSFQKCININDFVFCYGGMNISQKGEINTSNELNSFNLTTNEWFSKGYKDCFPNDRIDFSFNKIIAFGLLYGGISMTKEQYHDELWIFNSKDQNWTFLETTGDKPGKIRGHSAEIFEDSLYLFGGQDNKKQYPCNMFKLEIEKSKWILLESLGKVPEGRVNHEMRKLDKNRMIIIGGFKGFLMTIEKVQSDIFIYNINTSTWEEVSIESSIPISFKSNYHLITYDENLVYSQFVLFGGYSNIENEKSILLLSENKETYEEIEPSNDNQHNEEIIVYQQEKIDFYSKEIKEKEELLKKLKAHHLEIKSLKDNYANDKEEEKKNEIKNDELKHIILIFEDLINSKQKLKYILQRKNLASFEVMSTSQDLIIKYLEILTKIQNNRDEELEKIYTLSDISEIKSSFIYKLKSVKNKLIKYSNKENELNLEMEKIKYLIKTPDELFQNDKKETDHIFNDNNIN